MKAQFCVSPFQRNLRSLLLQRLKFQEGALLTAAAIVAYVLTGGFIFYGAFKLVSACWRQGNERDFLLVQDPIPFVDIIVDVSENPALAGYAVVPIS